MENFSQCPNCGHKIGCGCSGGSQIQTAVDGKTVCSSCKTSYEKNIIMGREIKDENGNVIGFQG